jgi:hypothetical protein
MRRRATLLLLGAALALPAAGHDFTLTDTLVIFKADGTYQIDMTCDLDALALGVSPQTDSTELAARLRGLGPAELAERLRRLEDYFERRVRVFFDERPAAPAVSFPDYGTPLAGESEVPTVLGTTARLEGRVPPGAATFSFRASRSFPAVHLTVLHQRFAAHRELLEQGVPSAAYALDEPAAAASRSEVAGRYLVLGFRHIVPDGLDHVLFVLGLFLLAARLGPLLWQVSAFTAAHTLTLALSTYGVFDLPPAVVEPLIALSIAYVAAENLVTEELKPWRPWVVFGFGLLHGLGFAGVLAELGLPRQELLTALVAFNAGVELGQLAVILAAFAAVGWLRGKSWYRRRVVVPCSLAIALTGLYWAVERVGLIS